MTNHSDNSLAKALAKTATPRVLLVKSRGWWGPEHGGNHLKKLDALHGASVTSDLPSGGHTLPTLPSSVGIQDAVAARDYWQRHLANQTFTMSVAMKSGKYPMSLSFDSANTHMWTRAASPEESADAFDRPREKVGPRVFDAQRALLMDRLIPSLERPWKVLASHDRNLFLGARLPDGKTYVVVLRVVSRGVSHFVSAHPRDQAGINKLITALRPVVPAGHASGKKKPLRKAAVDLVSLNRLDEIVGFRDSQVASLTGSALAEPHCRALQAPARAIAANQGNLEPKSKPLTGLPASVSADPDENIAVKPSLRKSWVVVFPNGLAKSYIHGHYRKNPKTGEMVWVESFSDKRTTKQGMTLFAHDLHRQDHFKQNLAEGRLREAMHSFHDLDHDAAHKLAGTLGLHNGDKHADKKELMRAVRGKVLQQQQDYQAQVKMQEDKAKGKGKGPAPEAKSAVKPEAKPEATPAPPTAEMDMHAVMDSAEKHLGTESTFEIFDHLPQRTGDDPRWSKAEMYRAIMAIQKERKADKHGKAKQSLLEANGGSPLGIEAKKPDSNRHALILPDASSPGKYRYSAYDEHGFYTHATHDTADQALDEAIKEGFTEHAPGSLDRLSQTDTWAQGMKRAEAAQAGWKAPAKAPESPPEAPAAKTPSQSTPAASSPSQPDPEDQVLDINGAEVPYAWKLVDAEDLAPTSEKADNQFRDRTRAASDEQVASMAANLKFRLLSDSPLMDYGAPVLAQDGKTIIGGNGRSLAIRRAYGMGQADGYQKDLTKRAARFGIDPAAVAKMKAPVLVRVLQQDVDIKQAAIASNEGGGARMSALEQARVDGERLGDLSDFEADEEGDFNNRANLPFIRRFLGTMPVAQRSAFQAADGGLSQEGISRLRNAVLYRAYGDSDVLSRLVESADPAQRNVLSALTRAAPTVAQASADVKAGNLHDLDVSADIVAATTLLAQVRGEGKFGSVDEYLNQQNLFGDPLSDATKIILKHFDRNLRSSKAMAGFLTDYYAAVRQIGDPKQMGMFADATPDKPTLLRQTDAQRQNAPSPQAALF